MKLYGGRIIRNKLRQQMGERKELRDAVVYEVVPASRYCWVQIQGSNTRIRAWYPENWEATPQYLKPGNAVQISHPGGNKSRIEVIGHGLLLPTPVAGGTGPPSPGAAGDAVLTGCAVYPTNPASMGAKVAPGTYRIGGVTYSLSGMIMDRTDIIMDRSDLVMDLVGDSVSFDAASSTYFRYDTIVADTTGTADVVKGSNFSPTTDPIPAPPSASSGQVRVGWVLIYPNMATVTAADINRLFVAPVAVELRVVIADDDLGWDELSTTITISGRDQYGNLIVRTGPGYYVTIGWIRGNGTLSYGVSQDESAPLSFYMGSWEAVTYTRNQEVTDVSPMFTIAESSLGFSNIAIITLRSEGGGIMGEPA
jgi:hypothetical protein